MGGSKKTYMEYHAYATLEDVIEKYNLDAEEQMFYQTLCDIRYKNK
jgi:hypothetical protein